MIKKWKKAAALVVMTTTLFAGTLNVSAEGVKDVFDAKYYADTNTDLKAIYGYDEKALYNHYITYGIKEGRCGSQTFNVAAYRMAYPDLAAAFGDNWDAYVNHYFTVGKVEGRTAGTPGATGATGAAGSTGTVGAAGNQQTVTAQPINTYIQHGSKFYNSDWAPQAYETTDKAYGPEAYISCYADDGFPDKITCKRELYIKDSDYWNTVSASDGYEIKTLRFAVRTTLEGVRIGKNGGYGINALYTGDFDYTKWVIGWESANAVNKPKQHTASSNGENVTSYSDAFAVNYNGVQYAGCYVQVNMQYTRYVGLAHAFYDVTVCLPKGYNDFAISVSYPTESYNQQTKKYYIHTRTKYIPMP